MNKNNLKRFNNFLDKLIPQGKLLPKGSKIISMKEIENKLGKNKLKNILLKIDSMSTYAIGHIVNQICRKLSDDQIYLNIGCWKGFTLVSGMIVSWYVIFKPCFTFSYLLDWTKIFGFNS